ncbi:hypothetical protein DAEQUDRAFT_730553 [Daedalea quercina L-15889]|uniref:Uncharacterized protein n=1 Tax=Daedalea quercina L-15889 TaxID=1314783 RepID=A0A165MWB1_9APHY|nr:hypothetical protein DAEQUDRAFT_730553 [Daedalea quercina L-15889]
MAHPDSELPPPPYARFADDPPNYDPAKALADFNALSSESKAKFSVGIAQAASQDDAASHFKEAASAAADAAEQIDTMFILLTAKLMSLEDTQSFVDQFKIIKEHYRSVVKDSRELATNIAQYAESFDSVVVKFCADRTLTVERRKTKINEFITKSDEIKGSAERMQKRFKDLKDEFTKFVGSFSTWAKAREEADEKKIKELYKDISDIDDKINAMDAAMAVIGAGLGVTLGVTGLLATLFPPAAPWIVGIGLSLAGVELASLTGLAIAKCILLNEKRNKENQIRDLQDEISKLKATRTQLEEKGQTDLLTFTVNIQAISNVWVNVQNDAQDIRKWLEDGAAVADTPAYMKASLDHTVKAYASMARYLKDYANGITETVKKFGA